jgi:hypothetical protein
LIRAVGVGPSLLFWTDVCLVESQPWFRMVDFFNAVEGNGLFHTHRAKHRYDQMYETFQSNVQSWLAKEFIYFLPNRPPGSLRPFLGDEIR